MIRTNIYSFKALDQERENAVKNGFDRLAQHMGEKIVFKTFGVKLPVNREGLVVPRNIGVGKLDTAVDLHVFTVPLERGPQNRMGVGLILSGVSFLDSTREPEHIESTAAHEGAHSLGFVLAGSPQHDSNNAGIGHCIDGGCIMYKQRRDTDSSAQAYSARLLNQRRLPNGQMTRESLGLPQNDFCFPCKSDFATHGTSMLELIQRFRTASGQVNGGPIIYR